MSLNPMSDVHVRPKYSAAKAYVEGMTVTCCNIISDKIWIFSII